MREGPLRSFQVCRILTGRTCLRWLLLLIRLVVVSSICTMASGSLTCHHADLLGRRHESPALRYFVVWAVFIMLVTGGGATHVDIACDPELVRLAIALTSLPVCVSSVDPAAFVAAVEAGALMVEIGNYDSFYETGVVFSPDQILNLTKETRRILPSMPLSVTVPHTLGLPDQVKLAELLEQEGADIIQTEGGKCSNPSASGVLGLIEKAAPTLASAYSISRAVKIPVMCSSGLSAVTAPMAITAGAAGVGVGSAINKLNDVVAMIAEVKNIADSLKLPSQLDVRKERSLNL
ncbi:hypothetical protein EUGRSUZ_D00307 [Eucalyptus grandis]|uniref:Uncharacterized protein ycf23 n=2 Tax=Eucalyptus grandis TaxID=71139 RepID=A0A059CCS0_EUCGR|nr:hypothetical protein EUGRSUZ_D00307 [Eucalyptus grandis]